MYGPNTSYFPQYFDESHKSFFTGTESKASKDGGRFRCVCGLVYCSALGCDAKEQNLSYLFDAFRAKVVRISLPMIGSL